MSKLTKERVQDFLRRLEALSEETGIVISGCGCCGSPSLDPPFADTSRPIRYAVGPKHFDNLAALDKYNKNEWGALLTSGADEVAEPLPTDHE